MVLVDWSVSRKQYTDLHIVDRSYLYIIVTSNDQSSLYRHAAPTPDSWLTVEYNRATNDKKLAKSVPYAHAEQYNKIPYM